MPAAFDSLAPTYDADFTDSPIARHLRERVHARLDRLIAPGETALELGCGTGEDALHLARRGVHVIATDASEAMLDAARTKLAGYANVRVEHLDLSDLNPYPAEEKVDLVFANFGVLNCLSGWQPLAAWLATIVAPGGRAAFGVMPPLCLWEIGWHALHGEFDVAFRRWGGGTTFEGKRTTADAKHDVPTNHDLPVGTGRALSAPAIFYPSPGKLARDFAPWFRRTRVEPLGLWLPPSDIYGVIERRPPLLRVLTALDDRIGRIPALAAFADHYWIEFERDGIVHGVDESG
ncbi:MAG: class I SAM-dependent methyltransferase [Anaerolineae bacterium]|nr:class I SAM-dependent methyltransferase [Anaerolineae bacterium]